MLDSIEAAVAGDPMGPRRWIVRSLPTLRRHLRQRGHEISHETIRRLLRKHKISPRANHKRLVANPHPQRNAQFEYIEQERRDFVQTGWPIVSVDTKKKELIGCFAQAGQAWLPQPTSVNLHDFPSDALGRAVPYGIYDLQRSEGHLYVGCSADTPDFAVDNLVAWWRDVGCHHYPEAPELLVLADGGGSNGYRARRWKYQLQQQLADAFNLVVTVLHYPPGASKWNPIEHRLFSQISHSFAATPLLSLDLMLELIRSTTTTTGLTVQATLVERLYSSGLSVSDADMADLLLRPHGPCLLWSYTIRPRINREVIS